MAAALAGSGVLLTAQQPPAGVAKPWVLERTPDGKPDLQGIWTNATITPLERLGQNLPLVLTEEAAAAEEKATSAAI